MNAVTVKPSYINCRGGKVDILCFGEAPGWEEYLKREAFVGPAGQFLRRVLADEFPNRRIALDNACPEALDRGKGKPDPEKLKSYEDYRRKSVKKHDPKIIILMGAVAMRGFGVSGGVLKRNAETFSENGTKFIISTHPSYHLHTKMQYVNMMKEVMSTVQTLLKRKRRRKTEVITDPNEVAVRLNRAVKMPCGFDIETSSLDPKEGVILSAAVATEEDLFSFPVSRPEVHPLFPNTNLLSLIWFWERCPQIIVHNLRFEVKWMRSLGAKDPQLIEDTYLQHWMIDEDSPGGLNYLTVTELKRAPYWTKIDPYKKTGMEKCPLKPLCVYNGYDALGTYDLHQKWLDHLGLWSNKYPVAELNSPDHLHIPRQQSKQRAFYEDVLVPFAKLLITVMDNGLHIDFDVLSDIRRKMMKRCSGYERKIRETFPGVVLNSPKQMRYLLFEHLKLPVIKRTDKGAASTDQDVLEILSKKEPRLLPLLRARKLRSRISREIDPLYDLADDEGLVHTDFNFGSIVTGRLSSSNPNFQNVSRDAEHKECFTSRFPGGKLIVADYKQHELRIFAALAGEKKFLDRWEKDPDYDVHQETADELGKTRDTSKSCNFSIIYDISPKGLHEKYDIPLEEAKELIKKWKKLYPAIPAYHQAIRLQMEEFGYVETLFGRRRHVWNPRNGHQCRQGYNCTAQTPAVELSYMAMLRIQSVFDKRRMKSLLVLQVHDSVVVDSPKNEVKKSSHIVKREMLRTKPKTPEGIRIPIAVEVKVVDHL